jgi:hypothetical protein
MNVHHLTPCEDGRVVMETRAQLAQRTRREVAASWSGAESVVEELLTDRRVEAAREYGR